ncbi:hypothetical protein BH20ACT2_BH20ACT2_21290 [soil metagenome]
MRRTALLVAGLVVANLLVGVAPAGAAPPTVTCAAAVDHDSSGPLLVRATGVGACDAPVDHMVVVSIGSEILAPLLSLPLGSNTARCDGCRTLSARAVALLVPALPYSASVADFITGPPGSTIATGRGCQPFLAPNQAVCVASTTF